MKECDSCKQTQLTNARLLANNKELEEKLRAKDVVIDVLKELINGRMRKNTYLATAQEYKIKDIFNEGV